MYIGNPQSNIDELQGHGMINPNIVSGDDLDNALFHGFSDDPEAVKIVEEIQVQQARVDQAKLDLEQAKDEKDIAVTTLRPITAELNEMYNLRNSGTVTDPAEKAELDSKIIEFQAKKDHYRMKYSKLNGEISRLGTLIGGASGMIYGKTMKYKEITGEDLPYEEEKVDLSTKLDKEDQAKYQAIRDAKAKAEALANKASEKTGLSKNMIYGLGAVALIGLVVVMKKKK